ncbi:MAG: nucleoside hydrolase [Chloroflexi bacterium]|nr:nucleoside hydrolase [Chloroflexota bacterium]
MRRFWIDTDTASDDAVAILMALRWPGVRVEGISVISGNVPVEMAGKNARYTVELCEAETPVYLGMPAPLLRKPSYAYFFHGPDGMGGMNYPEPERPFAAGHAVDALTRAIRELSGELELVTLGPLTNLAAAFRLAPDLPKKIRQCTIMGGAAATLGNITPAAEFNIWVDPEAASIVFHSGMPILMVGWENCRGEANLDEADRDLVRSFGTKYADFTLDCNATATQTNQEWLGDPGLALPDPVTMAVALDPEVCTRRSSHFVDVETQSELTRGMTVVDELGVLKQPPNAEVCWSIDPARWKEALYKVLR